MQEWRNGWMRRTKTTNQTICDPGIQFDMEHPILKKISLERTMCYGSCPVYKVTIFGDGRVKWEGERFVAMEGRLEWLTTRRRLTALAKAVEKINYFVLSWTPGMGETDCPSAITSVEFRDGRCRTIEHYLGDPHAPEELDKLEASIDRLAGTAPYVGRT